ncbi:hypothetical protein [Streptomyces uncialis]|uniref:hypothetical protein n=1 Tax=Streptomyces uncialis TaxID=1048205 RepID=UPI0033F4FF28
MSRLEDLQSRRNQNIRSADELRAEPKRVSSEVQRTAKQGGDISELKDRARGPKGQIREIDAGQEQVREELRELLLTIPNLPDETAPDGDSDEFAVEIRRFGTFQARRANIRTGARTTSPSSSPPSTAPACPSAAPWPPSSNSASSRTAPSSSPNPSSRTSASAVSRRKEHRRHDVLVASATSLVATPFPRRIGRDARSVHACCRADAAEGGAVDR